ncbi:hypothetical protein GEMRC1_006697 [Eukaryota sp. GEM-RC1]
MYGTSGVMITDIQKYTNLSEIDVLELLLRSSHFAPTAPCTLDLVPSDVDPLVFKETPRVLFGSGKEFSCKEVEVGGQRVLLVVVPSFKMAKSAVVLNLGDFSVRSISFDV